MLKIAKLAKAAHEPKFNDDFFFFFFFFFVGGGGLFIYQNLYSHIAANADRHIMPERNKITSTGARMISECVCVCGGGGGVELINLPYLLYVFGKTGLSKQC